MLGRPPGPAGLTKNPRLTGNRGFLEICCRVYKIPPTMPWQRDTRWHLDVCPMARIPLSQVLNVVAICNRD